MTSSGRRSRDFNCGEFAAIPSLVGERELVTANARIMAANNAGQILGPALVGALVAFVPVASLLFVDIAPSSSRRAAWP